MSNDSGSYLWTAVFLFAIFVGTPNAIYKDTVNVVEVACAGTWGADGVCTGKLSEHGRLSFALNPLTRTVALTVEASEGNWYISSRFYKDCAIVTLRTGSALRLKISA